MVRRALLLLALAGCEADIASGTYYCGPAGACPPDLACDGATAVCVLPSQVDPFGCGPEGNGNEPDDELAAPFDLGTAGCETAVVAREACIDAADDVDHLALTTPASCATAVEVLVQHPVAFAPLSVELLDGAGEVIATGVVIEEIDETGRTQLAATAEVGAAAPAVVRVRLADGDDCGGACAHNRYSVTVR